MSRRRGATPPGGSRRGRVLPTLEDLREELLRGHPRCRRVQAGGVPRTVSLAQAVCDWATPEGQAIAACASSEGLERNRAKRERIADSAAATRREQGDRWFVAERRRQLEAVRELAARFEREDQAAAEIAAIAARRSAA